MKKGYRMFVNSSPADNDVAIEKFMAEDKDRKLIEVRHYANISQQVMDTHKIPGLQVPKGMQQVQLVCMFCDVLVYEKSLNELNNTDNNGVQLTAIS